MTPRNTRRIKIAAWARGSRNLRSLGYTPPLSEWAYNPGMVLSGPETAQEATQTGNAATATGGGNWGAQTGDFDCCAARTCTHAEAFEDAPDTHTHGLDDYTCRERLVGDCVIEREVAEAVAREREAIAVFVENGDYRSVYDRRRVLPREIRSGAHNEGAR